MKRLRRHARGLTVLAAVHVLVACGTETEGYDPTHRLEIVSPEDGAEVSLPFSVEVRADVDLEDSEYSLAIYYDGLEAGSTDGASFEVEQLDAGPHAIHVSLVGPDGELAGAEDEVTVTVEESS